MAAMAPPATTSVHAGAAVAPPIAPDSCGGGEGFGLGDGDAGATTGAGETGGAACG